MDRRLLEKLKKSPAFLAGAVIAALAGLYVLYTGRGGPVGEEAVSSDPWESPMAATEAGFGGAAVESQDFQAMIDPISGAVVGLYEITAEQAEEIADIQEQVSAPAPAPTAPPVLPVRPAPAPVRPKPKPAPKPKPGKLATRRHITPSRTTIKKGETVTLTGRLIDARGKGVPGVQVKITRPEGPHFFVRKDDIRYILESD